MGHYDGVEERIAEQRVENDKIIRPLTPEQFAAAYFRAQMEHEQWKLDEAMRSIKYWHDKYTKLGVEPPARAIKVLTKDGGDYQYKVTHDPEIRAIIRGENEED